MVLLSFLAVGFPIRYLLEDFWGRNSCGMKDKNKDEEIS